MTEVTALVDALHVSQTKAVVVTTGGGTRVVPELLERGGGSATLISALVPYGVEETCELLGGRPDKVVSEPVARALAMVAYQRARRRCPDDPVIGVAATSILQRTPSEREGRLHAVYAALQTRDQTVSLTLEFTDAPALFGTSDAFAIRAAEEALCVEMMLNLLAEGSDISERVSLAAGVTGRLVRRESRVAFDLEADLPAAVFIVSPDGALTRQIDANPNGGFRRYIMPGSFNPAHDGHFAMAEAVERMTGEPVVFELAVRNADKPPIDLCALEDRLASIGRGGPRRVWVTDAPTFAEKAKLFGPSTFVVGHDTAARIAEPRFYGSEAARDAALADLAFLGARFLVFPRVYGGQRHDALDGTSFPPALRSLCDMADECEGSDLSSSAIRTAAR